MSQIYNLKSAGSRIPAATGEGKSCVHLLSFMIREQEQYVQPHSPQTRQRQQQLHNEHIRIQQENEELELKLNYLRGQETHKESAAKWVVRQQFRQLQLEEQDSQRTQQPTQHHQKIQEKDQQLDSWTAQLRDGEMHHKQKMPQTLQYHTQPKTQLKQHQLNQSNPCTSETVNLKSRPPSENLGRSITATPPSSTPPSFSPSPSTSRPFFSLRSLGAVQSKRGNTITITPRKSGVGVASVTAPGETRPLHSVPSPAAHGVGEEDKKRYPTAEEIEVIGGYQSLDKSCLAKSKGTQKRTKVCFDEVQLEVVFEYPSESSLLASFPCPPLPDPDKQEEEEEGEDEEEEEEEKGVLLFRSSRSGEVGSGKVLRVDESCRL